jgi:hypothetical protein
MKPSKATGTSKGKKPRPSAKERQLEYDGVIAPDPLLKEVGEANEHIADPRERERVVPSRPCKASHHESVSSLSVAHVYIRN